MVVDVAPKTLISVGKAPTTIFALFCIINFVSFDISSYICNLFKGTAVPIPTLEVL